MTHTQNISSRNAFARFMMGSAMLAFGAARLARESESSSGRLLVLLGSMKAAEGVTKFCPLKAMNSSLMSNNSLQQMAGGNTSQDASAHTGASSNSGNQSGQTLENIMQIVENIMQMFANGNTAQSTMGGAQSMSSSVGQATKNSSNSQTSESATQTITNIAQTVAPQVGQILNDVANIAGSQNTAGTNSNGNSTTTGTSNTNVKMNGNENSKNTANSNSHSYKDANTNSKNANSSSPLSNGNTQKSSSNNNKPKTNTTKSNELGQ